MNLLGLHNFHLAVYAIVGMHYTGCSVSEFLKHTAILARTKRFPPTYSTGDTTVDLFTDAQRVYFLHSTTPN